MLKKVTRKWFNKKSGTWTTKVYTYSHPSTRGKVLVNKKGKINTKNVENLRELIKNNDAYDDKTKRMLLADLNVQVSIRHKNKKELTTTGFMGMQEEDSIIRFFTNAGYSIEDAAEEMDVSVDDILDINNWSSGNLIIAGRMFKFNWTYTGNFIEEV